VTYFQCQGKTPSQLLPHVHQVVSLLKRALLGTHHGAATHEHLDYYLDEFTVSVQSTAVTEPWEAVLPAGPTGPSLSIGLIVETAGRPCGSKGDVSAMSILLRPSASAGQPRWCSGVVCAAAIFGAAAQVFSRQGPPLLSGYVIVGEALSSARAEDSIKFAARMFSAPDMESICRTSRAAEVVQLRSEVSHLRLRVGEPFQPGTLRITARDASRAVLPNVPLAVEVSGSPNVFAREGLAQLVDDGSIIPRSPASVRFRIRTICPGTGADTFVSVVITQ
jgi:hypothetical protein